MGVSQRRSSCSGLLIPFSLLFYLRAALSTSLASTGHPGRCLATGPGSAASRKDFGFFWHFWGGMAPGLVGGMDGQTDPEAGGMCSAWLCCKAARDLSEYGVGGIYPLVCRITCAGCGVELGFLRLLPAEPPLHSVPQFPLSRWQLSPRGSLGVIEKGRLGVWCRILHLWLLHPAAGGDRNVLFSPYLPPVIPTMSKSQAWGWG